MIAELHPRLGFIAILKKGLWPMIVIAILAYVVTQDAPEHLPILSKDWLHWIIATNGWLLLIFGVIACLLLLAVYHQVTGFLRLENGVLERHSGLGRRTNMTHEGALQRYQQDLAKGRWKYLRDSLPCNRIVLSEMQECEIEQDTLSIGRGIRNYYGFTFIPKHPQTVWMKLRIDMPVGLEDKQEREFLGLIRKEMQRTP